jgi:1-acyl-sn-glycerol-3-phosphate acyltransferase
MELPLLIEALFEIIRHAVRFVLWCLGAMPRRIAGRRYSGDGRPEIPTGVVVAIALICIAVVLWRMGALGSKPAYRL